MCTEQKQGSIVEIKMDIFTLLIFVPFVFVSSVYHEKSKMYSPEVEETIERYSRNAKIPIEEIKQTRFDRTSASETRIVVLKESEKLK